MLPNLSLFYKHSILDYQLNISITNNMSTRVSQSRQADLSNTNSDILDSSSFLSERVPLNYSVCLEKLKGAPISNSYRSCFTPYEPSLTDQDNKKQLTFEYNFTLPELKEQIESPQNIPFMVKIQSQRSQSSEGQQSIKIFQYLKMQQNKEQKEKNFDFVRSKNDIVFVKCVDFPPWPCQIKKIQRVPGMVPEILYQVDFICENALSWVTEDQIISFTTESCQYIKNRIKSKKLKKAIKIGIKKAQQNLQRLYNQKITRECSQSTQSNQQQIEKQKTTFTKSFFDTYTQMITNDQGFLTLKKQLIATSQPNKHNFKPIVLVSKTQKQKMIDDYFNNLKQSLGVKAVVSIRQKQKKQRIPKVIKIIGFKRVENEVPEKISIEFKKSKTISKRQNTKSLSKSCKKILKKKSTPKDLIIQTPRLPLSFFQRIQSVDKKHQKRIQKEQNLNKSNNSSMLLQKITNLTSEMNDQISKKYVSKDDNENSRYQQDQKLKTKSSIQLQIEYQKESDHYYSQTSVQQNNQFKDIFQLLNSGKQKMEDFSSVNLSKNLNGKDQQLTKQQETSLVKHIQSYNDQLFKVRKIKDKEYVENEILQKLSKVGPYNLAYSQIVDQLCMMTGLMKQQKNKNPQCYFFYNEIIKEVQKLVNRIHNSMTKNEGEQMTLERLKLKKCVDNKIWLLTNCLNTKKKY